MFTIVATWLVHSASKGNNVHVATNKKNQLKTNKTSLKLYKSTPDVTLSNQISGLATFAPCSVRTCTLVTYKFEMQALGVLVAELERQVAAAAAALLHTQALAARRIVQQRLKLHAHTHLDPHSCRCGAKEQIKCYKVQFVR